MKLTSALDKIQVGLKHRDMEGFVPQKPLRDRVGRVRESKIMLDLAKAAHGKTST